MIISTVWWYLSLSTGLVAAVPIVIAFIWERCCQHNSSNRSRSQLGDWLCTVGWPRSPGGVVGLYRLVIIQLSSMQAIRSRLPRRVWHSIHLVSFPLVWVVIMHSGAAGTDVDNRWYTLGVLSPVILSVFVILYRILAGTGRRSRNDRRDERVSVERGGD
jgi:hypothetical protein